MNGRELKFRAWHEKRKEMYEVFSFGNDFVYKNTLNGVGTAGVPDHRIDIVVEQYSGIKSHQDQEIYEGDVISWNVKTDEAKDKRLSAVVEFIDGCFMAAERPLIMLFSFNVISDITVDTNIHESPELV